MDAGSVRFPLVDALRGIAALSVLAYHGAFVLGALDENGLGPWLAELNVGVVLFFAISGFLLYRPFAVARLTGARPPALRRYALRRVLRIVPAYWVALTLIAIATARDDVGTPEGLITYYGFLQGYRPQTVVGGIGQAWTLGVELAFYALLPVLALLVSRLRTPSRPVRGEVVLLGGLLALSVAYKLVLLEVVAPGDDRLLVGLIALPAQLDHFVLGMGLAVASATGPGTDRGSRAARILARAPAVAWAAAGAAFVALGAGWHVGEETGRVLTEHALRGCVALGLLLPAVIAPDGGGAVQWLLARRWLAWVGVVSYGVYLWHLDILRELETTGLADWAVLAGGAALSLLAGAMSWYGLERRMVALGR